MPPCHVIITYKHVTCVPFQRGSPADTADDLIWRRAKVGISFLLSSWANARFWFCLRMLVFFLLMFVCLSVCLLAFLLLRHICVFCSTRSRREKLAFSDEYMSYSFTKILVMFCVFCDWVWLYRFFSVRFPRRTLVCMRLFWRMTEERTLPNWIWQTKVTSSCYTLAELVTEHSKYITNNAQISLSWRIQGFDEWSFQFYR